MGKDLNEKASNMNTWETDFLDETKNKLYFWVISAIRVLNCLNFKKERERETGDLINNGTSRSKTFYHK